MYLGSESALAVEWYRLMLQLCLVCHFYVIDSGLVMGEFSPNCLFYLN